MIFFILIILFQLIDTVFLFQLIRLLKNTNTSKNTVYVPAAKPVIEDKPLTREDVVNILVEAGLRKGND